MNVPGVKGIVKAICVSEARGVQKEYREKAVLVKGWGIEGDAHGGDWHRQVSLLPYEEVKKFNERGAGVSHGDFGENIVMEGVNLRDLPVGSVIRIGDAALRITQIGKECHTHCQIYRKMGDCIMPREGVFARVEAGGGIAVGDAVLTDVPRERPFRAAVVTLSDRGAEGSREDLSGPIIARALEEAGYVVEEALVLPDDRIKLEEALINLSDRRQADLILTTGGTGFSRRDVTPEATMAVAERNAPGIAEAIRAHSLQITGRAMLGRGVSVIRGGTIIVNLPGSPKAVRECLEFVLPHLAHGIEILRGDETDCGSNV